ncbi:glycoside hydrolase family 43 protein [Paenibacillus alkalitolerans]|uniref:glycoside hydrolase family 43 protein n=1 Tax=Paenibacillus alkalitolerans TaxID=2799335 RepID=UPI001F2C4C0A|nr:glycoside hydrolase family 43 protein [Paenibacillus alkalitolerans]
MNRYYRMLFTCLVLLIIIATGIFMNSRGDRLAGHVEPDETIADKGEKLVDTAADKSTIAEEVRLDTEALIVYNIDDVRGHLTLPTEGNHETRITWNSENPTVITTTGEVSRPASGSGDVTVTLTATITKNDVSATKSFQARVRELPKEEDYAGYFFTYFIGDRFINGEQIYFALSEGNDPLRWNELNDGQPVLTSEIGEQGLRDPFIIRSPEGDKFYMIATDLKIHGNGDWNRAQRSGSRSIMVWESNDLIHWSEQRMIQVAPAEAGNTWAPEVIYDHTTNEYVVFWASNIFENESHTGNARQKMLYSKTRDFYVFTEPQVYMDFGYSIIDTTMIAHDGKIYRFTKDERDNSASTPYGKTVFQEVGNSVLDTNFELIKEGVGNMKWVEGPTIFKSNTENKWYLFVDEFSGRGYVPLETTDLNSGEWVMSSSYELPPHPRHGTVIPITKTEYDAIYAKYVAAAKT